MPPEPLTAPAPAKVNLVLEVLGKRDDGYHEIDSILQTIDLADRVTVAFDGAGPPLWASGPFAAGTPCDQSNLAWRAAQALAREVGRDPAPLRIELVKNVPPAGGLGGGASDAATVLRLLQRAWPPVTEEQLLAVAAAVGSDEAALVLGGTVRARGRGERVERLAPLARQGIVLFVPPQSIAGKTGSMFAALAATPFDDGAVAAKFAREMPARLHGEDVYNAFERVAYDVFTGLAALSESLESRLGQAVRLAGAGPTLFWIGPPGDAMAVAAAASGTDCTIIPTATEVSLWAK